MSNYRFIPSDIPSRCLKLLERPLEEAKKINFEVTFLLSVAALGLVTPFERLQKKHQSKDSGRMYIEDELKSPIGESNIFPKEQFSWSGWFYGEVPTDNIRNDPSSWKGQGSGNDGVRSLQGRKINTKTLIYVIRNALSHGSIETSAGRKISEICFISENRVPKNNVAEIGNSTETQPRNYLVVLCSPEEFQRFITCWFNYLTHQEIKPEMLFEPLDAA